MSVQSPGWQLKVLKSLKLSVGKAGNASGGARDWVDDMFETSALLSTVLKVIHPYLYECGQETLLKMRSLPDLHLALLMWSSVLNACMVVSN